jgi:hypothetical protein
VDSYFLLIVILAFLLRRLRPKAIVESRLWQGQCIWLFEHACAAADLYCLDQEMRRHKHL